MNYIMLKASFPIYKTIDIIIHKHMEQHMQSGSHSSITTMITTTKTTTISISPFCVLNCSSFSLHANLDYQFLLRLFSFSLDRLSPFLGCPFSFPACLYLLHLIIPSQLPIFHKFLPFPGCYSYNSPTTISATCCQPFDSSPKLLNSSKNEGPKSA